MATIKPVSVPTKRLAESITAASSSLKLNNIKNWNGDALTSSDFGTLLYAVLRNDANTIIEIIELDPSTIASASITINKRGLAFDGTDFTTQTTAYKKTWVKNETLVEIGTNVPQMLGHFIRSITAQTIDDLLQYTTELTPLDNKDLVSKKYVDDNAGGGVISLNRIVVAGDAGENVAEGELVYFDDTDNEWKLCDADTAATVENVMLGIAQGAGTNGNAITGGVLLAGLDQKQSGMTKGDIMYAGNTAGAISSSVGTKEVTIGIAASTTTLFFMPRFNQQITEDEQDALTGTIGTPSSTNKFVTDDGLDRVINDQTGTSYTLVLTDRLKLIDESNSSAITLTVPPNSSVAFPTGTVIYIRQKGAGQVTLAEGSGVTIESPGSIKALMSLDSMVKITKVATNNWVLEGDLDFSQSDVTGSRVEDTTYTNSTGRWMFVVINSQSLARNSDPAAAAYHTAKIHATADPPTTEIARAGRNGRTDGSTSESMIIYVSMVFMVPPGWKYRITQTIAGGGSPNASVNSWWETTL